MVAPDSDDGDDGLNEIVERPMPVEHRVILLAERVRVLLRENKELKARVAKLEVTYQRGFGVFLVFPFLGGAAGFLATYWSWIFRPWGK